MSDRREYEARQAASVAADDAIARAAGVTAGKLVERPVCLVTSFTERADLPPGALLCRMSAEVAATLAGIGLHEPVSLRQLPGKWWIANVDLASVNPGFEAGGGNTRVVASSEELDHRYGDGYCEVVGGPFNHPDEVNGSYFVSSRFDRNRLGDLAALCEIPGWIASRQAKNGLAEPIPFPAMAGKWWVCGMGGGVCTTADIEIALRGGERFHPITDGPFDTRDKAEYAFDVLWESPE